jgi:hypothetical protein
MKRGLKIALFTSAIAIGCLFYYLYRNPRLKFISLNWKDKTGTYKFGSTENEFSANEGELFNNIYYIKDQYNVSGGFIYGEKQVLRVTNSLDRKKTFFSIIDSSDNVVRKVTIDWASKLMY